MTMRDNFELAHAGALPASSGSLEDQPTLADQQGELIQELFEAQVQRAPNTVAVSYEGQSLTYGELNARANQLARYLLGRGVGPDQLVGICVERSLEMVIGLLGILKAGGAYLPLDPQYPAQRLAYMLQDARAPVLLTHGAVLAHLPQTSATRVCLDLAHEHLVGAAVHDQVDQVGASRLQEHLLELEAVEDQRGRLGVVPVDDSGKLALAVETARALAEQVAGGGFQLHACALPHELGGCAANSRGPRIMRG